MNMTDDDIFDMFENDETPFKEHTAPKESSNNFNYNRNNNGNKWNKNNNWKSNKPKQPSNWDRTDFIPKTMNHSLFHRSGKSFAFYPFDPKHLITDEVMDKLKNIGKVLQQKEYTYRHNSSSTDAIANTLLETKDLKVESYLPWKSYNSNIENPVFKFSTELGYCIAKPFHKSFDKLPAPVRAIYANSIDTILGKDCIDPINFLLVYTEDGRDSLPGKNEKIDFTVIGNLFFLLKVCKEANIPVININNKNFLDKFKTVLNS